MSRIGANEVTGGSGLAMLGSGLMFMLLGAVSAITQSLAFPESDASLGPLFVVWLVTCMFYMVGSVLLLMPQTRVVVACFSGFSAIVAVLLLGTTLAHVLKARSGVSLLEYLILGSYQFFLAVLIITVLMGVDRQGYRG